MFLLILELEFNWRIESNWNLSILFEFLILRSLQGGAETDPPPPEVVSYQAGAEYALQRYPTAHLQHMHGESSSNPVIYWREII